MEYSDPYPSSVPHIILVPETISMQLLFYISSVIIQSLMALLCAMLFIFSGYFALNNHRLLLENPQQKQQKKGKQNIICEVTALNYDHSQNSQQQQPMSMQQQMSATQYRIQQRRLNYALCYCIPWTICVLTFDAGVVVLIASVCFLGFAFVCNMRRMFPNWKVSTLVYVLPAIAAFFPYISGTHQLYAWTAVEDPISTS